MLVLVGRMAGACRECRIQMEQGRVSPLGRQCRPLQDRQGGACWPIRSAAMSVLGGGRAAAVRVDRRPSAGMLRGACLEAVELWNVWSNKNGCCYSPPAFLNGTTFGAMSRVASMAAAAFSMAKRTGSVSTRA